MLLRGENMLLILLLRVCAMVLGLLLRLRLLPLVPVRLVLLLVRLMWVPLVLLLVLLLLDRFRACERAPTEEDDGGA